MNEAPAPAKHRKRQKERQARQARVLRDAIVLMVGAAVLAPAAAAGRYGPAPKTPSQHVVVRTELVPESDGFDWLDAAAGYGLAIASVAVVLLVLAGRRPRAGSTKT